MTRTFFKPLELGCVAHELGTLPLKCHKPEKPALVKPNLELQVDSRKGVYVCDLSIFPFSPEVNPTPTLVALALRLSRETILPRAQFFFSDLLHNIIHVVNQSGDKIKVFVSNLSGVELTVLEKEDNKNGGKILKPGEFISRDRTRTPDPFDTVVESVMVFGLEYNSQDKFLPNPVTYVAKPGVVCVIE